MAVEIVMESMMMMKTKNPPPWSGERERERERSICSETLVFNGDGALGHKKLSASRIMIFKHL
jgi:hypothetical protein